MKNLNVFQKRVLLVSLAFSIGAFIAAVNAYQVVKKRVVSYKEVVAAQETKLGIMYRQVDSLRIINDSLRGEVFPLETQVTRYEIALSSLKQKDSGAAKKFEKILTSETE